MWNDLYTVFDARTLDECKGTVNRWFRQLCCVSFSSRCASAFDVALPNLFSPLVGGFNNNNNDNNNNNN